MPKRKKNDPKKNVAHGGKGGTVTFLATLIATAIGGAVVANNPEHEGMVGQATPVAAGVIGAIFAGIWNWIKH
jgi:hypothetical protein